MLYIILILMAIGAIYWIFSLVGKFLEKTWWIFLILIILGVSYYFGGLEVFALVFGGVVAVVIIVGIFVVIGTIIESNKEKKITLEREKQKTEVIKGNNDEKQRRHNNETLLKEELERNCKYLGEMNLKRWRNQLSNYVDKHYSSSFDEICMNFTRQIEEQYIAKKAEEWMKDFEEYIVQRPNGSPISKMLEEVDCEALRMTHSTRNSKILEFYLKQGAKRMGPDVPAKFKISDTGNFVFYQPTKYLEHLYKVSNTMALPDKKEEIIIDENDEEWGDI